MSKEMVVSASAHDTKIAILEDGQVVEVYFERQQEYSLAGSIYKGRVTRILPGMQSAFVNIGLERDAFLYVSDFMEQIEEVDRVAPSGEERPEPRRSERPAEMTEPRPAAAAEAPVAPAPVAEAAATEARTAQPERGGRPERSDRNAERPVRAERPERNGGYAERGAERPEGSAPGAGPGDKHRRFSRRGRRHRGRHRDLPESKYARAGAPSAPVEEAPPRPAAEYTPAAEPVPERILLPGESLAKYRAPSGFAEHPSAPAAEAGSAHSMTPSTEEPPSSAMGIGIREGVVAESMALSGTALVDASSPETTAIEAAPAPVETPATDADRDDDDSAPANAAADLSDDAADELDADRPPEITAEEAVESMREEMMIEHLEEEAAEIAESGKVPPEALEAPSGEPEVPSWIMMEDRVLDVIEDDDMDSEEPAGGSQDLAEGGFATDRLAANEGEEPAELRSAAGETVSPEGTRQASLRERSGNPRFQRRQRWGRRGPQRSERGGRGGPQSRPGRGYERQAPKPLIGDLLKEGQEIIVQVAKEPLGKKGARITSHIALPGRYIVYMPTLDHTGVSRKIASDEERHRLKHIIVELTRDLPGGFIVRTAGEGHTEEDIRQDVQFLVNLWADVKTKAETSRAPALLHHDLDLTLRTLRDQLSDEFTTIWVDNEQAYEQIVSLVQKFQPALVHRVRLYTKEVPLFEETGVQDEINKALKPKVWLKSGGYIVINQTEALVAIDVNTGKYVGKSNRLEDTIVKTNVEAIQEIVRQIRLRDLGGIIVIDFIDMDERKNRQKVMSTLEEAMRADKAPSKILSFNEFGLLAITRKRVRQSLERTLCQPCAYCSGAGLVKTPETVSLEILAEARKISEELAGKQITLRVNPEVAKTLKERNNPVMETLEEITGSGVIIRGDAAVHIENFYFD
jgi:Rne/Rng family ribonuclease